MLRSIEADIALLAPHDPDPVELVNPDGSSIFLLTCEHAGRAVPARLADLGIPAAEMDRHIASDVGAEALSLHLSTLLDAGLVMQRYSRLVVDCNRPFEATDCVPEISDGTTVPANVGIGRAARLQRFDEIHRPFHRTITELLDGRAAKGKPTVLVSVHSFTPRLRGGSARPWFVGVLSNRDGSFAQAFLTALRSAHPDIPCAYNQPYVVDDLSDHTIPVHGEARGLPHLLLEIRNDLISDHDGQQRWASLVAEVLTATTDQKDPSDGR